MGMFERFSEYFGFLDFEVDRLYAIYQKTVRQTKITREGLWLWYDGYYTAGGARLYNPRSIVCALTDNQLRNYWTSSGTYDSVFSYIKNNVAEVQDDLALMFAGEAVPADIQEYAAAAMQLDFIFYPERKYADAIILELKVDSTPEDAIRQIKDKEYGLRFKGRLGESPKYTGKVLAVGISYNREIKKHSCRIEALA